jgi:hypothetical protein
MNAGDSDIPTLIYKWVNGAFVEVQQLPVSAGEDAEYFSFDGDHYLATASIRTGSDPYDLNSISTIYKWNGGKWMPFQDVPTFAAKQWHYFEFEGRRCLALAQNLPGRDATVVHGRASTIFQWNGEKFEALQNVESRAGYSFHYFEHGVSHYLGYCDHGLSSKLYKWDGERFEPFQDFSNMGGRSFKYFRRDGEGYLCYADILNRSSLYKWDGEIFRPIQSLGGEGGRDFSLFELDGVLHLVRVCFIHGTPADPIPTLKSQLFRWEAGTFTLVEEFPTNGAVDGVPFMADGKPYLAVANSLTPEIRFRQDSIIYRLAGSEVVRDQS